MKPVTALSPNYTVLKRSVERELVAGTERLKRSYRDEVVRTVWNIGRILRKQMGLGDRPSTANAVLIARLSKDLNRCDSFFYDAAKFNRAYPVRPPRDLTWSHYSLLIRIDDPVKRLMLEKRALKNGINTKEMRLLTRALLPSSNPGGKAAMLRTERGQLYHYRIAGTPSDKRVMIDLGFGIERQVRCKEGSLHSGLIGRASRKNDFYSIRISSYEKERLYTYAAKLQKVTDGDTLVARVDLGFRTWITQTFRLRGIDAPEMSCTAGLKAKAEVAVRLAASPSIIIKSYRQEKYGRFLADIFYLKGCKDRERVLREGVFLNQELLDAGFAIPYDAS